MKTLPITDIKKTLLATEFESVIYFTKSDNLIYPEMKPREYDTLEIPVRLRFKNKKLPDDLLNVKITYTINNKKYKQSSECIIHNNTVHFSNIPDEEASIYYFTLTLEEKKKIIHLDCYLLINQSLEKFYRNPLKIVYIGQSYLTRVEDKKPKNKKRTKISKTLRYK